MNHVRPVSIGSDCRCPACGAPVDPAAFHVDLMRDVIAHGGRTWKVQPKIAEIMHQIVKAYPDTVTELDLLTGLYGAAEAHHKTQNLIAQYVSHLRGMLAPTGYTVLRRNGRIALARADV